MAQSSSWSSGNIKHDDVQSQYYSDDEAMDDATFECEICVETTPIHNSFNPKGCTHFYCTQCTVKYIESKLSDANSSRISCPWPGCDGVLDPELCRPILPPKLFDRWGDALVDSAIQASNKLYCPYADCSVLLINDDDVDDNNNDGRGHRRRRRRINFFKALFKKREKPLIMAECPFCEREICAKCKSPWHSEMDCVTYQRLKGQVGGEEKMLDWIAARNKWQRCPNCRIYIAKRDGCSFIRCRCGISFCYRCTSVKVDLKTHICHICNRY